MNDSIYTVVFSVVLGTVCAVILTSVGQFTQPYREKNAEAEITRNILRVLEIDAGENPGPEKLISVYKEQVKVEVNSETGKDERYLRMEDGKVTTIAVPFSGPGLWGPVYGYLAVDGQMKTIKGITFYKHEETPGLGGEIDKDWFKNQFKGKSTKKPDGSYGLTVCVGGKKASTNNEVDGITGATLTSTKVEAMLVKVMKTFRKEVK
jgi:Na+-transporting NADH:ubiquinone oxidoreductase subunit C